MRFGEMLVRLAHGASLSVALTPHALPTRPHGPPLRLRPDPPPKLNFELPVQGRISSTFGLRMHPILRKLKPHTGLDIAARRGTPVLATQTGRVRWAGRIGGYGNTVILDHGNDQETLYGHLEMILVRQGQTVSGGEIIGLVGSTGRATGPHVHYEKLVHGKAVDPLA